MDQLIYLTRHASTLRTELQKEKVSSQDSRWKSPHLDDITILGCLQARILGEYFLQQKVKNPVFILPDIPRNEQTSQNIARTMNISLQPGSNYLITPFLRERLPKELASDLERKQLPGLESTWDIGSQTHQILWSLCRALENKSVIPVLNGGIIASFFTYLTGRVPRGIMGNCGLYTFGKRREDFYLIKDYQPNKSLREKLERNAV